jgi:hypothetical protein
MDYSGGPNNDSFYLKNGVFNNFKAQSAFFTRPLSQKRPDIDFKVLP